MASLLHQAQGKTIPIEPLLESLSCPICTDTFTDPKVTPCGHTFCHGCIEEWISRNTPNAFCPLCNHPNIQRASLLKHHIFDDLLTKIMQQKHAAEREYFDMLRQPSTNDSDSDSEGEHKTTTATTTSTAALTPIEQVFRKHMKRSLGTFQQYASSVEAHFGEMERKTSSRLAQLRGIKETTNNPTLTKEMLSLKTHAAKLAENKKLALSKLVSDYEHFLTTSMPNPSLLPCTARLFADGRSGYISINVDPTTFTNSLIAKLHDVYEKEGDPISEIIGDLTLHYVPPLSADAESAVVVPLIEGSTIYQQLGGGPVPLDGRLLVVGTFKRTSEMPRKCFALVGKSGDVQDYYRCVDCKKNWLCQSCSLTCHDGHTIVPYLMQHVPSFNCCYCKKTKCCKLREDQQKGEKK